MTIHPLKILIQHICISTPDKADHCNKLAGVVCVLMRLFDDAMYAELIKWIYKFSRNTKVYKIEFIEIKLIGCHANTHFGCVRDILVFLRIYFFNNIYL